MLALWCCSRARSYAVRARCLSGRAGLPAGSSVLDFPALSPTMTTGNLATWLVKELGAFKVGQPLCDIETDKATVSFDSVDEGVLAKILVQAGTNDLKVGTPIAIVADDAETAAKVRSMDLSLLVGGGTSSASVTPPAPTPKAAPAAAPAGAAKRTVVSPAAAFLLNSYGVDPSSVSGSQVLPSGVTVVSKADALRAVEGKSLAPKPLVSIQVAAAPAPKVVAAAPAGTGRATAAQPATLPTDIAFEDVPVSNMRKVIASRLTEAKQSRPHFYATADCEIDNILAWRKDLKEKLGVTPSINDVIVKAAALALRDVPRVNCRLEADGSVAQNKSIDVAVAVATPTGLITPIVKNADQKGVLQVSADMKDLASRAKANKLKLDEFQGGSFAVSNLGMFGISQFTAVISPPHAAILAVGGGRQEFDCEGDLKAVNVLTVQISCDRRLLDDVTAAQFLSVFQTYMKEPMLMNL